MFKTKNNRIYSIVFVSLFRLNKNYITTYSKDDYVIDYQTI